MTTHYTIHGCVTRIKVARLLAYSARLTTYNHWQREQHSITVADERCKPPNSASLTIMPAAS